MILKNKYPICEFDTCKKTIIQPTSVLAERLPEKCVITFFRKELEQLVYENELPVIGYLRSEVLDIPIYEYVHGVERLSVTMAFCGAPSAAVALEDLHAMGCQKFVVCGGAGALEKGSKAGEIVIPIAAVRDEGVSYHYLEPSREVECHKGAFQTAVSSLRQMGIPFITGKTWTTDAFYRETPDMVAYRRNEGCITVEMEAAAFFAVSQYYDIPLVQLLYIGDDVSGEEWDSRNWNTQRKIRDSLLSYAVEIIEKM